MRASQTEILDSLKVRDLNIVLDTGSNYIVTSSTVIRSFAIESPKRGPRENNALSYIEYSLDYGSNWKTIKRGDVVSIDARPYNDLIELRTNIPNTNVEITLIEEY